MKSFITVLVLVITMLVSFAFAVEFSDLPKQHWAYEPIIEMANNGILSGYPDGTFLPDKSITRAEFAKILVAGLKLDNNGAEIEFRDVPKTHWAYSYVQIASKYLSAYRSSENVLMYMPEEQAVREDVAVAMVIAAGLENAKYDLKTLDRFTDKNEISTNFRKYVAIAVENNLMRGHEGGNFEPKGYLTRAQVSQLIRNAEVEISKIVLIEEEEYFTDIKFLEDTLELDLGNNWEKYIYTNADKVSQVYYPTQRRLKHLANDYAEHPIETTSTYKDADPSNSYWFGWGEPSKYNVKVMLKSDPSVYKIISFKNPFYITVDGEEGSKVTLFKNQNSVSINVRTLHELSSIEYGFNKNNLKKSKVTPFKLNVANIDDGLLYIKITDKNKLYRETTISFVRESNYGPYVIEPDDEYFKDVYFDTTSLKLDLGNNWDKYVYTSLDGNRNVYTPAQRYLTYDYNSAYSYDKTTKETKSNSYLMFNDKDEITFRVMLKDNHSRYYDIKLKNPFYIKASSVDYEAGKYRIGVDVKKTYNAVSKMELMHDDGTWTDLSFDFKGNYFYRALVDVTARINGDFQSVYVRVTDEYGNSFEAPVWFEPTENKDVIGTWYLEEGYMPERHSVDSRLIIDDDQIKFIGYASYDIKGKYYVYNDLIVAEFDTYTSMVSDEQKVEMQRIPFRIVIDGDNVGRRIIALKDSNEVKYINNNGVQATRDLNLKKGYVFNSTPNVKADLFEDIKYNKVLGSLDLGSHYEEYIYTWTDSKKLNEKALLENITERKGPTYFPSQRELNYYYGQDEEGNMIGGADNTKFGGTYVLVAEKNNTSNYRTYKIDDPFGDIYYDAEKDSLECNGLISRFVLYRGSVNGDSYAPYSYGQLTDLMNNYLSNKEKGNIKFSDFIKNDYTYEHVYDENGHAVVALKNNILATKLIRVEPKPFENAELEFDFETLSIDLGPDWEKYTSFTIGSNVYTPSQRYLCFNSSSSNFVAGNARKTKAKYVDSSTFDYAFTPDTTSKTMYIQSAEGTKSITIPNPFHINSTVKFGSYSLVMAGEEMEFNVYTLNETKSIEYRFVANGYKKVDNNSLKIKVPQYGDKDYKYLQIKMTDIYGNNCTWEYYMLDKEAFDLDYEIYALSSVGCIGGKFLLTNVNEVVEEFEVADNVDIPSELTSERVSKDMKQLYVVVGIDKNNKIRKIIALDDISIHGANNHKDYDNEYGYDWCLTDGKLIKGYTYSSYDVYKNGKLISSGGYDVKVDKKEYDNVGTVLVSRVVVEDGKISYFNSTKSNVSEALNNLTGRVYSFKNEQDKLCLFVAVDK